MGSKAECKRNYRKADAEYTKKRKENEKQEAKNKRKAMTNYA